MPTVNFQCGHCRNVMGVDSSYLGKQVRCPHCKQVVLAPSQAPAPAPAGATAPKPPPSPFPSPHSLKDEHESIFGEHVDEDLFGGGPKAKVEVPPVQARPPSNAGMQLEPTVFQVPGLQPGAAPVVASNSSAMVTAQQPAAPAPSNYPPPAAIPSTNPGSITEQAAAPTLSPAHELLRRAENSGITTTSILMILVPYAVIMTGIALYLLLRQGGGPPHPFEMLPDMGDPKSGKTSQSYLRIKPTEPLPPQLIIPLGQKLEIGDLAVTPTQVEVRKITYKYRASNTQPVPQAEDSLVLNLAVKNISSNVQFRPSDPVFDHYWKDGDTTKHPLERMPYTFVEINHKKFCSPVKFDKYTQPIRPGDNLLDEYVDGQEDDKKILKPGEEIKTVIVTDPADRVPAVHLPSHRGKLLWRVQLRRGLVRYEDKEWSRTVVFGVEFDKDQIKR